MGRTRPSHVENDARKPGGAASKMGGTRPRHVEKDTRSLEVDTSELLWENRNNDTTRRWIPPRCVENGKNEEVGTSSPLLCCFGVVSK